MSRIRVYIKPFDTEGNYTEYEEVTSSVDSGGLAALKRSIDSTEYDVGVMKINSFSIKLANEDGRFADTEAPRSMFYYKRSDSLVKLIWDPNDFDQTCGPINAGQGILTESYAVTIFEGILNDEGTSQNINDQKISFKCFGFEYLLQRITVPYSSITVGDTMEEIILALLDQAPFNELITVSAANITVGSNVAIDNKDDLENEVVYSALEDILLTANAVLYIEGGEVFVSPREPSVENQYTFYGEASNNGIENIETIKNYRSGLHRVFNYWTWSDASYLSEDSTSINIFGVRKKELGLELITDGTSRQTILDNLRDEFSTRKKEMEITTSINDARLELRILDKVNIDYPTIVYAADGEGIPLYGIATHNNFQYPLDEYAFTISTLDFFKIIAITYNLKTEKITYKLRAI